MILSFHPCFETDVNIVLGSRPLNSDDMEYIRKADAVILPQGRIENFQEACLNSRARFFPNYDARFQYPGKIGQSRLFEKLGLPIPETFRWPTVNAFSKAHPDGFNSVRDFPFMVKDNRSHEGEGVFLVKDETELASVLAILSKRETSGFCGFITQKYIPSDGNVLRAVIIGKKIITYWKRPTSPDQVITTISRGAAIDRNWQPDLQYKGRISARTLSQKTGINLAAVDFIFSSRDQNAVPLFLEINYYFGRKGLGGSQPYYRLLYSAIQEWLGDIGLPPEKVKLI